MISDTLIKQQGFEALKERLGIVGMERFIMLINREKSDYTQWRKNLFEDLTVEEISSAAMALRNKADNND